MFLSKVWKAYHGVMLAKTGNGKCRSVTFSKKFICLLQQQTTKLNHNQPKTVDIWNINQQQPYSQNPLIHKSVLTSPNSISWQSVMQISSGRRWQRSADGPWTTNLTMLTAAEMKKNSTLVLESVSEFFFKKISGWCKAYIRIHHTQESNSNSESKFQIIKESSHPRKEIFSLATN